MRGLITTMAALAAGAGLLLATGDATALPAARPTASADVVPQAMLHKVQYSGGFRVWALGPIPSGFGDEFRTGRPFIAGRTYYGRRAYRSRVYYGNRRYYRVRRFAY